MAESWLESMIEEIRLKESELTNLKRAANTIFRSKGEEPPFPDGETDDATAGPLRIRPDEYYGKGFATAARSYLLRRKQAVPADEILRALEQGGFDFEAIGWKDENRVRTVAMSMAKNTAQFHRLPNGMFGLVEFYPDAIDRKKSRKTNGDEKNEAASE